MNSSFSPNINHETGIAYGTVYVNSLKSHVWDIIESANLSDSIYDEWYNESIERIKHFLEENEIEFEDGDKDLEDLIGIVQDCIDDGKIESNRSVENLLFETNPDSYYSEYHVLEGEINTPDGKMEVMISNSDGTDFMFVSKSPYTKMVNKTFFNIPNAGNLQSPNDDGIEAYSVPPDWYRTEDVFEE